MLTELCGYLRNWFQDEKLYGDFKIADGLISYADGTELPLQEGQYFRVIGSVFNDGVYKYANSVSSTESSADDSSLLKDEEFDGSVWTMKVPPDFVALANDIKAWQDKNGSLDSAAMSPFSSESFGGYSYSKSSGNTADGSSGASWQSVFGNRIMRYRKVF